MPTIVVRGSQVTLEASTPPNANCTLSFKGTSGSDMTPLGVGVRQSDGSGYNFWTFTIPEGMSRGSASTKVTCGSLSDEASITIS